MIRTATPATSHHQGSSLAVGSAPGMKPSFGVGIGSVKSGGFLEKVLPRFLKKSLEGKPYLLCQPFSGELLNQTRLNNGFDSSIDFSEQVCLTFGDGDTVLLGGEHFTNGL